MATPSHRTGDSYVYERSHEIGANRFSQERVDWSVERSGADDLVLGFKLDGSPGGFEDHVLGNDLSERHVSADGKVEMTERLLAFPLSLRTTWQEDFVDDRRQGAQTSAHVHRSYKAVGWEDIAVPAGRFHALKIEGTGTIVAKISTPATVFGGAAASATSATSVAHAERAHDDVVTNLSYRTIYYVPEIRSYVKFVDERFDSQGVRTTRDTSLLASFKPGA